MPERQMKNSDLETLCTTLSNGVSCHLYVLPILSFLQLLCDTTATVILLSCQQRNLCIDLDHRTVIWLFNAVGWLYLGLCHLLSGQKARRLSVRRPLLKFQSRFSNKLPGCQSEIHTFMHLMLCSCLLRLALWLNSRLWMAFLSWVQVFGHPQTERDSISLSLLQGEWMLCVLASAKRSISLYV